MSESAANDPDKFEFPRNPALHEVELTLRQNAHVVVGKHKGDTEEDIGLVGGFGEPKDKTLRETWGKHVNVAVGEPSWAADGHKNEGHWREEIIFSSLVTFRCSPPFTAQNISSAVSIIVVSMLSPATLMSACSYSSTWLSISREWETKSNKR
jgi:hypothetical protein